MNKRSELLAELDRFAAELEGVTREIERQKTEFAQVKAQLDSDLRMVTARVRAEEADASSKKARYVFELEELGANKELAEKHLIALKAEADAAERQAKDAQKRREAALQSAKREAELLDYNLKHRSAAERDLRAAQTQLAEIVERVATRERDLVEAANKLAAMETRHAEVERARTALEQQVQSLGSELKVLEDRHAFVLKEADERTRTASEVQAQIARAKESLAELEVVHKTRQQAATEEMARFKSDATTTAQKEADQTVEAAKFEAQKLVKEADLKAQNLIKDADLQAQAKVREAEARAEALVAETQRVRQDAVNEAADVRAKAASEVADIRRQAAEDAVRVRKKAADAVQRTLGRAEKAAGEIRAEAEATAATVRDKALKDYEAAVRDAVEQQAQAEALRASIQTEFDSRMAEAQTEADALKTKTLADAETLKGRIQADYEAELAKAKELSKEILDTAKSKAKTLKDSTQKDYDARLKDAHDHYAEKIAEAEGKAKGIVARAEELAGKTAETAAKEIERLTAEAQERLQKAAQEAARLLAIADEKAKSTIAQADAQAKATTEQAAAQAKSTVGEADKYRHDLVEKTDREAKEKQQRLQAELIAKRDASTAELTEWLHAERKKAKAARRQQSEEAAVIVRKYVEMRATKFMVEAKSPFEVADLGDETEKAVRAILHDDGISEKDKLLKYVNEDGGAKLRKVMRRRRLIKLVGWATAAIALAAALGFGAYKRVTQAKSGPSESDLYAQKILSNKRVDRMYLDQQTSVYKPSYTENVLFTRRYVANELDRGYQDKYIVSLNRFIVHKLDLNDKILVRIIPMEANLIRRLDKLANKMTPANEKDIRGDMARAERETVADLKELLGSEKNYLEFRRFKESFYTENAPQ